MVSKSLIPDVLEFLPDFKHNYDLNKIPISKPTKYLSKTMSKNGPLPSGCGIAKRQKNSGTTGAGHELHGNHDHRLLSTAAPQTS